MSASKRLGELLIEKGWLSAWQLQAALEAQRSNKEYLGRILVQKGWLSEERLLEALGEQFGIARVALAERAIDWKLASRFPAALLRGHHCLPIHEDRQSLTVAIANPLDVWAVSELERLSGHKIKLVLASEQEIQAVIRWTEECSVESLDQRLKRERHDTP